jgi:hypothetical protein
MNFKVKAISKLKLEKDEILIINLGEDADGGTINNFRTAFRGKFPQFADKTMIIAGVDVKFSKVNYSAALASNATEEKLEKSDAAPNDAGVTQS